MRKRREDKMGTGVNRAEIGGGSGTGKLLQRRAMRGGILSASPSSSLHICCGRNNRRVQGKDGRSSRNWDVVPKHQGGRARSHWQGSQSGSTFASHDCHFEDFLGYVEAEDSFVRDSNGVYVQEHDQVESNRFAYGLSEVKRIRRVRSGRLVSNENQSTEDLKLLVETVHETTDERATRTNALGEGAARVVALKEEEALMHLQQNNTNGYIDVTSLKDVLVNLRCPRSALKVFRTLQERGSLDHLASDASVYSVLINQMAKLASSGDALALQVRDTLH